MNTPLPGYEVTRHMSSEATATVLREDVLRGLAAERKWLSPKWFYDAKGSALFEEITRLPEYYPTRVEREILAVRAREIAAGTQARTLVELGSGSSEKTRLLIDALCSLGTLRRYTPVDVSETALHQAAGALLADYPSLTVHALVADFQTSLALPVAEPPVLFAFLGGTVGNLLPAERAAFLTAVRAVLRPGDALVLGTDLVKDERTLLAAYDDSAGITAAFNKNVLYVLNRQLGADFDPTAFDHVALWEADHEWIEMRLRSRHPQTIKLPALDLVVSFDEGEDLRTEISAKFRAATVRSELARAGFALRHWWSDPHSRFALSLATPSATLSN